jgi:type VI secretion system ImpM family protein
VLLASTGYWGKLPNFPDFIKYNSGSDEVQDFDKWLNEGLYSARQKFLFDWESAYLNSATFNFIFPGPSNNLSGIIYPGKDKSNRLSPFIRFILHSLESLSKPHLLPLINSSFYKNFGQFLPAALNCTTNEEISNLSNNSSPLTVDEINAREADYFNYLYSAKINSLFSDTDDRKEIRKVILFNNLQSVLKEININTGENFKLGLRFPVSENTNMDTVFWIQCCQLITGNKKLPYLFWNRSDVLNKYCYLFWNKPGSHFYPVLLKPELEMDDIVELDSEGSFEKAKNSINGELYDILKKEDSKLIQIIQLFNKNIS